MRSGREDPQGGGSPSWCAGRVGGGMVGQGDNGEAAGSAGNRLVGRGFRCVVVSEASVGASADAGGNFHDQSRTPVCGWTMGEYGGDLGEGRRTDRKSAQNHVVHETQDR